eukprot:4129199-Amphidinium_carterae.1
MNNAHSYVVTINGARAFLEVETDVRCMRRSVCTSDRVVYFDATRRHRVNVPGSKYAKSIVMYSPSRLVPQRFFDELIDFGFPIGVEGGVYPFAQPFEPMGRTPTPSKRLACNAVEAPLAVKATKARSSHDDRRHDPDDYEPLSRLAREVSLSPTIAWETQEDARAHATRTTDGCEHGVTADAKSNNARSSNEDRLYDPDDFEPVSRLGKEVELSPTLVWESPEFDAGAGDEVKADRDEMSRLIQWTKGLPCGHSAKQLRLILMGEKKTLKKLTACKGENDRAKADVLIRAAMARCGMKAVSAGADKSQADAEGGKGRSQSQPPARGSSATEGSAARSSSQPPEGRAKEGKGGKDKGKGKESNKGSGKGSKPPTFKLVATEWPAEMQPQEAWKPEQPGVYLSEDAADVVKWAAQCRFARVPILAVTPCKPDLANYPVHRRVLKFEEHREGAEMRIVWLASFVTQLTYCPIPDFNTKEVIVAKTTRQSVILRGYVEKSALEDSKVRKLLSKGKHAAREVMDDLIPTKARVHLLDIWNVKEGDGSKCTFVCRVAEPKVDSFMTLSGAGAVWFDTPSDHYSREEVLLTWLKTNDGDGGNRPMSKAEAEVVMRQNYGHLGIVQGKNNDFAIRACKELTQRIRSSLGQPCERLWRMSNIPPALEVEDLKDVLLQLGRGLATWNVRCEDPPPAYAFPLTFGYQKFSLKIFDPRAAWAPKEREQVARESGAKSWVDALQGNLLKEPKVKVSDINENDNEREGAAEKPLRSNRNTPERPAKKPRRTQQDGEVDDDDAEGVMEVSDDEQAEDVQESDNEASSECLSEEESLGFGTPGEDDGAPDRARRALTFARAKRVVRAPSREAKAEFDGRVSNVEAAVGRMEAIMASLLAQQQQQQMFMNQVQTHLTQQAAASQGALSQATVPPGAMPEQGASS